MGFNGKELHFTYAYPVISNQADATDLVVSGGIEEDGTHMQGHASIDIRNSSVLVTFLEDWTVPSDEFHGFSLDDKIGNVARMVDLGVTSAVSGVSSEDLFREANGIAINLAGLTVSAGDTITLTVTFGLNGTADSDDLRGDGANERISGLAGNDVLRGMGGTDTLRGNGGNDTLVGGACADILDGGKAADSEWGSAGKDVFMFVSGNMRDTIMDFQPGVDKIDVSGWGVIDGYSQLHSLATDKGGDVHISAGGDTLVIKDMTVADLTVNFFLFDG